jgi:hypothetical protein
MRGALRTIYMQEFALLSWRSDCGTVQQSGVVRALAGTRNRLVDILCHLPLFNVKRSHLATLAKTEIYLILEYKTLRYIHAMNSTIHIPRNQHAVVESDPTSNMVKRGQSDSKQTLQNVTHPSGSYSAKFLSLALAASRSSMAVSRPAIAVLRSAMATLTAPLTATIRASHRVTAAIRSAMATLR